MSTNVIMPQMGESIYEGTVTKWLKKVGDKVTRDEPLLEISTDKVDSEIPSPVDGVLSHVLVHEGETVKVGAAVAIIGEAEAIAAGVPALPEAPVTEAVQAPPAPAEEAHPVPSLPEPIEISAAAGPPQEPAVESGGEIAETLHEAAVPD